MKREILIVTIYLIVGAMIGSIFDVNWLAKGYWVPYCIAGYFIFLSYSYFVGYTMFMPPVSMSRSESKFRFARMFVGCFAAPLSAVFLLIGWYRNNFGDLAGV